MAIETYRIKGNKVRYRVVIYDKKSKIASATFTRKSDAEAWQDEQLTKQERERFFPYRPKDVTFDELFNDWLTIHAIPNKAANSVVKDKQCYKHYIEKLFGKLKVDTIQPELIDKLKDDLIKKTELKNTSINKILEILRTVFNFAVNRRYIIYSPMSSIKMLPVHDQPFNYWSYEEASVFLSYTNTKYIGEKRWIYVFYKLALETGLRMGEMVGLKWTSVMFSQNLIQVCSTFDRALNEIKPTTKSKRIRYVGISESLKFELLQLKAKTKTETVFSSKTGLHICPDNFRHRSFLTDVKESGVKLIRIHDMRHTFASHYIMNGGNIHDLQMILGHSDIKVTMRYAHLSPSYIADKASIVKFDSSLNTPKNIISFTPNTDDEKTASTHVAPMDIKKASEI